MCDFLNLNNYELLKGVPIGQGSFGRVFKVVDNSSNEILAAKISLTQLSNDDKELITSLKREVNIISQLKHPSILKFIGYSPIDFTNNPFPVIITEYASNGTLNDIINLERQSRSPPMWDDTKKLINIYGIASAMSFLHSHEIIHRDLKPANILEDDHLFPKIADFGLSKINHSNIESMSTKITTGPKGTPIYIPPEVWDDSTFSKAGDVYAFSIIAFELITNEIPFNNCSMANLCNKVLYKKERPEFRFPINECYKNLITRCWSHDQNKRPTFDEIVFELRNNEGFITDCVNKDEFFEYVDLIESKGSSFNPCQKYQKILREKIIEKVEEEKNFSVVDDEKKKNFVDFKNISVLCFNDFSLLMQKSIISQLIQEKINEEFFLKINNFLAYLLQYVQENSKRCFGITTNDENKLLIELNKEEQINVLCNSTEQLLKSNSLESQSFIDHLNQMNDIIIEFKYPSDLFKQCYVSIMRLKRTIKSSIHMSIFFTGIKTIDVTFRKDQNIYSIVMDESVNEIESGFFFGGAFYGCTGLEKVTISPHVSTIGENVFYGCKSLKELVIPPSVTFLDHNCFEDCSSLEKVSIPNSVIEIGNGSFGYCSSLKSVIIPSSVIKIGIAAFEACKSITEITIPSSVKFINSNAFSECILLKNVIFQDPSSLMEIADEVFSKCTSLKKITIPPSVVKIGPNVFYKCYSLEEIKIYSSLTNQDKNAFPENVKIIKLD